MTELTDTEHETLLGHIGAWKWERQGLEAAEANFYTAVEAILASRLARVEALLDGAEENSMLWVRDLRAALAAPTPDEVQP